MSVTLPARDFQFRSSWLEQSSTHWEVLAPSWRARRAYLDQLSLYPLYEKDAYLTMARGFLALQGLAWFSDEAWTAYRLAGYDAVALTGAGVGPSPAEAHQAVQGLAEALAEVHRIARAAQPLESSTLQKLEEKILSTLPSPRTATQDGPFAGTLIEPSQIASALETLLREVQNQLAAGAPPIWVAAWAHHAFTRIHPYTGGNARGAFLLTQYILWRADLPGILLNAPERVAYFQALQAADQGQLAPWAELFLYGLQQATLYALSWGLPPNAPYEASLATFQKHFADWHGRHDRERSQRIMNNRYTVFDYMEEILRQVATELEQKLKTEDGRGTRALVAKAYPDSPYYYQFTNEIAEYAKRYGYTFNRGLPRGWFKLKFSLSANKKYQLVFPLHHGGHHDATLVVGAFLHFLEPLKYQQKRTRGRRSPKKEKSIYLFAPLAFERSPLAFCIEEDVPAVRSLLRSYVQGSLSGALVTLANEIY